MPSETTTVPADVRAAVDACWAVYHNHPDTKDWQAVRVKAMTAALTAADAVRLAGAGDVVERLEDRVWATPAYAPLDLMAEAATLITTLRADNARLSDELETDRMRLAACGVVAMSNTTESAAKNRDMHPIYRSASCDDVARAVDREMALRAEVARLRAAIAYWVQAADYMRAQQQLEMCDRAASGGEAEYLVAATALRDALGDTP
jgi:hypothetical protein